MMRSMFSGVSGLRNHQTRMDVIGNNIANVNTIGFKGSRVNFQDILSQNLQGAAAPQGNRGGTNPMQIGLGMSMASIDTIFTDGSTQTTGKQTDLALQGQGFFIVNDGDTSYYTRAGNFDFDTSGNYIVPGTGLKVQGWMADANGAINTTGAIGDIQIPIGTSMTPEPSQTITMTKNLDSETAGGTTYQTSVTIYDSLGAEHVLNINFIKPATPPTTDVAINAQQFDNATVGSTNTQNLTVYDSNGIARNLTVTTTLNTAYSAGPPVVDPTWDYVIQEGTTTLASGTNQLLSTFTAGITVSDGANLSFALSYPGATSDVGYTAGTPTYTGGTAATANAWQWTVTTNDSSVTLGTGAGPNPLTFTSEGAFSSGGGNLALTFSNGANPQTVAFNLNGLTQYASESTVNGSADGYSSGTLETVTLDTSGTITGRFSNGRSQALAQVALATFNNPAGLLKAANNSYTASNNSGIAQVGTANSGGRGSISPGSLEMSNVDLSQQFTDMIVTQRGFQANSKIITTSDEMLQDLVNLKR